jgi:hypothetical protein
METAGGLLAVRSAPAHALGQAERQQILRPARLARYAAGLPAFA